MQVPQHSPYSPYRYRTSAPTLPLLTLSVAYKCPNTPPTHLIGSVQVPQHSPYSPYRYRASAPTLPLLTLSVSCKCPNTPPTHLIGSVQVPQHSLYSPYRYRTSAPTLPLLTLSVSYKCPSTASFLPKTTWDAFLSLCHSSPLLNEQRNFNVQNITGPNLRVTYSL